ncbi:hypothetical protein E4P82_17370 [Candidatus Competibacter phosphatis]|uniref:Uncharacterized protein n=1 Tax=Candidatus Competibacter phosphatis TaxID=221280 RepID=A0ABX1TQ68_9GAMM|nr:hypothetical protein [Candidatus Competibacter phosphatis]NMQ20807.1 hypothetical protein [Candidatus Competibacter phosphatis]
MAVSRQSAHPFAPDEMLGVAIGIPNPDNKWQRHVGLIYWIDNSGPRFCHLAWHFMLRDEPLPADYFCGPSGLDPVNKIFMAAYVALLNQNVGDVPYGIDYDGTYFDDQGHYIVQPLGRGLTCATFILAVFARNGFDLVETESWPERPDDVEWQQQIIGVLGRYASREHIEAVKQNVGAKRFRPEEVAAGVVSQNIPLHFSAARVLAQEILHDMYGGNPIQ